MNDKQPKPGDAAKWAATNIARRNFNQDPAVTIQIAIDDCVASACQGWQMKQNVWVQLMADTMEYLQEVAPLLEDPHDKTTGVHEVVALIKKHLPEDFFKYGSADRPRIHNSKRDREYAAARKNVERFGH